MKAGTSHTHMHLSDATRGGQGHWGQTWESTGGVGDNGSRECVCCGGALGRSCPWAKPPVGRQQLRRAPQWSLLSLLPQSNVTSHLCGGHSPRSRGPSEGTGLQGGATCSPNQRGCHPRPGSEVSVGTSHVGTSIFNQLKRDSVTRTWIF